VPALSRARTGAIVRLGDELRFAGRETLRRHIERIEQLATLLDEDGVYPEDFVVFRVTGYRPEIGDPELIPGAALLGDLSALAERLSESAGWSPGELGGGQLGIDELAQRWGVSRKTIERARRRGLVGVRVDLGSGRRGVVFSVRAVEQYEARYPERIERAGAFTRLSGTERGRAVRWARGYERRLGWKSSRCAERIAQRLGRSRESVRRALLKHDEGSEDPVFHRAATPDGSAQRAMLRLALEGKRSGAIGARYGVRSATVNRAINRERLALIVGSGFAGNPGVVVDEGVLEDPIVREGLGTEAPTTLGGLIGSMREQRAAVVYEQNARAGACVALSARIAAELGSIDHAAPSGAALDRIETWMRWMIALRLALVSTQLHLALETIEQRIGGELGSLDPARGSELALSSIDAVHEAVRRFDPSSGGRLAARVSLALARFAARIDDVAPRREPGRAARLPSMEFGVEAWTDRIRSRVWWVRPESVRGDVLDALGETDRMILTRRHGMGGARPITLAELGGVLSTTAQGAQRMERSARRRAHEAMRALGEQTPDG
jgi:RNA polymerase primary sigma factor